MTSANRRSRVALVIVCLSSTAMVGATSAHASTTPGGSSAISQYVEVVPTAQGGVGTGSSGPRGVLSKSARRALIAEGGPDAKLLLKVATSPAYGAPQPSRPDQTPIPAGPDAASAAVGALDAPAVAGIVAASALAALIVLCFRMTRQPRTAAMLLHNGSGSRRS